MSIEGIWVIDPVSEERVWLPYDEIPNEVRWQIFKPIGGFIYPVGQFVQLELPKVPYFIKDWLPKRGRCVIYAPPKSGKSYLSLQIARHIGSNIPVLGIPVNQGVVLIVQFELGAEILQDRLMRTHRDYPNVYVGTTFSLKIDSDGGFRMLETAMAAVEPDVLILDPLYKMIAGDENETRDMRVVIDNLDKLLEIYNCSVLVIHHPGKDLRKGGRGSSVLEDWVDSYLEMKKTSKNGEPLKVKITPKMLRHAELPPEPVVAQMDDHFEFQLVTAEDTVKDKVRAYVRSCHPGSANRGEIIASGIGSNASVQDALNGLVEEKIIERVARGEYFWASKEDGGD